MLFRSKNCRYFLYSLLSVFSVVPSAHGPKKRSPGKRFPIRNKKTSRNIKTIPKRNRATPMTPVKKALSSGAKGKTAPKTMTTEPQRTSPVKMTRKQKPTIPPKIQTKKTIRKQKQSRAKRRNPRMSQTKMRRMKTRKRKKKH